MQTAKLLEDEPQATPWGKSQDKHLQKKLKHAGT
jgi:hypothetical protein